MTKETVMLETLEVITNMMKRVQENNGSLKDAIRLAEMLPHVWSQRVPE